MKCLKKVINLALALALFPVEIVVSVFAGLIFGIGNAFEFLLEVITGEIE
jgi:hypothetical protein